MPSWSTATVTSTRREWRIPAADPWGACLGDVQSAILAASIAYREAHGLPEDHQLWDDVLRFHVTDDEIVISFTLDHPASA
ncbi:hypothetical protein ACFUJU_13630 [Streptomyces sp. NPDC057235]|uniref:hypothetical protein n=1 Tax=Streptomyces sp. NPDC057235 TaxID=3346058 RepID=UPI00363DA9C6